MNSKPLLKKTSLVRLIRQLPEYEDWKRAVFIRDRFTCQHCGARNGRKRVIEADHIKSLAVLIRENDITTIAQALMCPVLWDIANGRCLCRSCHELTDSYPIQLRKKAKMSRKKSVHQ